MEKARLRISSLALGAILACAMALCALAVLPQAAHAQGSGTMNDPYVISGTSGELKGDGTSSDIYFLYRTAEPTTFTFDYKDTRFLNCGTWKDIKDDYPNYFEGPDGKASTDMPKGDIVITFMNDADARVKFTATKFNPGSIKVNFADGSNVFTAGKAKDYTFTYTKGDSANTYLDRIDGESVSIDKSGTYKRSYDALDAGYTNIGFLLNLKNSGDHEMGIWYYEPVVVKPIKPTAPKASDISGTQNSLNIDIPVSGKIGSKVMLQMKKGSKWTTVQTFANPAHGTKGDSTKRVVVKKLKPNTKYTFRVVGFCPAQGAGKPQLTSPASKTFSATTAPKDKPKVKSIAVTGAKQTYHPAVYNKGHWVGGTWSDGWWSKAYYSTNYTVKIKLAKKVKGAKGILVNGIWAKGSGTSFTVRMGDIGALKGKKKTFKVQAASAPGIGGPKVTKSAVVR